MRILSVIFALVFFAVGEIQSRAATHFVLMSNFSFTPSTLTVDVGDTVIWTNAVITGHDTVSQGVWASPLLARRGTFSFTFNVPPRTYNYVCSPHIGFGMVGSITVRAPVNNPPTASISAPPNNHTVLVGETFDVRVTATDDKGVTKVDLFVDGTLSQTDTTDPYVFSLNLPAGTHTILARATDAGGLTANSSITVNVQFANPAPAVTLTSPTNTATFNEPAIVVFAANVTGTVDRVEFLTNGVVMATDTTAPYSVTNNLLKGAYTVVARGIAPDTQIGTSAPAEIEVGEHIPEPPEVFVTTPFDGEFVSFSSNIVLRAQALDDDSPIAQLSLATVSNVLGTISNTNQFELLTFLPEGIHTIFATATDTTGLTTTSAPVTFTIQMAATNTYRANIAPGVLRLGFFGSSGLPYVFEYTTDGLAWNPVLTNVLYRRILFFDELIPTNEPMRIYRARSPMTPIPPVTPP